MGKKKRKNHVRQGQDLILNFKGVLMINSKRKGKTGELELAKIFTDTYGFESRRTQQFCGKGGESADIVRLTIYTLRSKTS